MLIKKKFIKDYLKSVKLSMSSFSKIKPQTIINSKKGNIYIKSTNRNIFLYSNGR